MPGTSTDEPNADQGASILVVDDVADTLEVISRNLETAGYRTLCAGSVDQAVEILAEQPVDLVITDYKMPQRNGMDLVRHIRANHPASEVMMITGFATVAGAVEAVKLGAEQYLAKPFTDEELLDAVAEALRKRRRRRVPAAGGGEQPLADLGLIGRSPAMHRLAEAIRKAAAAPVTVLISGETGTGKELVARAIHYRSPRATAPFVPVNCGGIPEGLLERELFGHVKGSFTGATETRAGFFQTADGGTLLLDEISETSAAMQVKLLRVLQEREIRMIGDDRTVALDLRIAAATNKELTELVAKGRFREDLYYRLAVIPIAVPPLRDRGEDVAELAHHFAARFAHQIDRPAPQLTDAALRALAAYDWPGNVRELENLIQRACVMCDRDRIDVADLPSPMRYSIACAGPVRRSLAAVEREHIERVLRAVGDNKSEAARILGISRKTLRQKLSQPAPDEAAAADG